jgi:PAS domain S-box-containing protein
MLIESMNEGALTLTKKGVILYANQCFARIVKCPLEQVVGGSFRPFLSAQDQATLRLLLKQADESGSAMQVLLNAGDGSQMPALLSIRPLAQDGCRRAISSMVVTDMTETRRKEEMLRALSHRLAQAQEAERGRVSFDLHNHITQPLCAILVRSQALAETLSERDDPSKRAAVRLREMLGQAVERVEHISRNLRSSVLEDLGLAAALRGASTKFAEQTGITVKLACLQSTARLPADADLVLYRIFQNALNNVLEHARARRVTARLEQVAGFIQLTIKDDGVGFDRDDWASGKGGRGVGLLGMSERASSLGGSLQVKSTRRTGTEIKVRIPLPGSATAAD